MILVAVIASMAAILVHEQERVREIEGKLVRASSGEKNGQHPLYVLRLHTDSLLQALKPHCTVYVRPAQIYMLLDNF